MTAGSDGQSLPSPGFDHADCLTVRRRSRPSMSRSPACHRKRAALVPNTHRSRSRGTSHKRTIVASPSRVILGVAVGRRAPHPPRRASHRRPLRRASDVEHPRSGQEDDRTVRKRLPTSRPTRRSRSARPRQPQVAGSTRQRPRPQVGDTCCTAYFNAPVGLGQAPPSRRTQSVDGRARRLLNTASLDEDRPGQSDHRLAQRRSRPWAPTCAEPLNPARHRR